MLRRLSIAAAIMLPALFMAGANANAAPARITPRVDAVGPGDWCGEQTQLCLRDPSDGGAGTTVLASRKSESDAEDWKLVRDTGRCPDAKVSSSCPGGWISSHYVNATIFVLKNVGQGSLCIRTSAATQYVAKMGACDTGNELSSAFLAFTVEGVPGAWVFESVDASNALGQFEWLTGGNSNDSTVFDKPGVPITALSEWQLISS